MVRVNLQPAFILHRRPYSNTSLIIECFTEHYGRQAMIARSARGMKSRYRGRLELFVPMLMNWSGRRELKNLGSVDFDQAPIFLEGKALLCGFYLNEILMRLLHRDDPYEKLFTIYQETLKQLAQNKPVEKVLRCFEKKMLIELGYGLSLTNELETGNLIQADGYYQYVPDCGFTRCHENEVERGVFSGESLLALHHEQFDNSLVLAEAKRLMRLAFGYQLGNKPLKSRDLLR